MSLSKIERGIFLSEKEKERVRLEFITSCFRVWREFKENTGLVPDEFNVLMEMEVEIKNKGIAIPSQALRVLSLIMERMELIGRGRKGDNGIDIMNLSKIGREKFLKSGCCEGEVISIDGVRREIQKQIRMDYFTLSCIFLNSILLKKTNDLLKRIDGAKKRGIETPGYIRKNLLRIRKEINSIQRDGNDKKGRGIYDGWHY